MYTLLTLGTKRCLELKGANPIYILTFSQTSLEQSCVLIKPACETRIV